MAEGLAIFADGHSARLKWHRLQREAADTPFTQSRLREGLSLGAAMEVDLRRHGDQGFACLHDATLDRETTGTGPVAAARGQSLRRLRLRDARGKPTREPLLFLDGLATALREGDDRACVQLDLKERRAGIDPADAASFRHDVSPCAERLILSGHDWDAVKFLGEQVPRLRLGFDPCDRPEAQALATKADFADFVEMTVNSAPEASIIYLHHPIILNAIAAGFDVVGAIHRHGREVDAWTLKLEQPDLAGILKRLMSVRVDQITTGDPLALEALWLGRALD